MGDATTIIVTGALVGTSCALLGSFLVLRKLSMLGDAISHAVLPGIVIAFMVTSSRASLPMFIGAALIGGLTSLFVQFLSDRGIQGDASIGVTFTSLFALGVVLVSLYGSNVDLDLDCVLYGEIAYVPFDTLEVGGLSFGARSLWVNGVLLLINAVVIVVFFKQFKLSSFDPGMAMSVGIPVTAFHYLLMALVSMTTVGAFESVGAILVVAMLIVPAAAAYLLTEHLWRMIGIAVALGVLSSILGYQLARYLDCSIAGAMGSVAGLFFAGAVFFSPNQGAVSRLVHRRRIRSLVAEEDVLLWAARQRELITDNGFTFDEIASLGRRPDGDLRKLLARLRRAELLSLEGGVWSLTAEGIGRGVELLRRHRLYESYLGEELGYDVDHIHDPADRVEHYITPDDASEIDETVQYPTKDPQGRKIPRVDGSTEEE